MIGNRIVHEKSICYVYGITRYYIINASATKKTCALVDRKHAKTREKTGKTVMPKKQPRIEPMISGRMRTCVIVLRRERQNLREQRGVIAQRRERGRERVHAPALSVPRNRGAYICLFVQ